MGVVNLVLRGAQVVVTIAELGLAAYATWRSLQVTEICQYDAFENAVICTEFGGEGPSGIGSFLLFNCVWTLIILAVLCLVPLCTKMHPIAVAVLDGLTMLFWFSGAVGFAVIVGLASQVVGSSQGFAIPGAMAGLAFIIWILFLASFIINVRIAKSGRKNHTSQSYGPGAHQATPSPGMNNFPPQQGYGGQPQGADKQGTYVQNMQPMQQQSPMQSPGPQYQQGMYPPPMHQQPMHGQPMHGQPMHGQPMHPQSPHQQSPVQSPGPQYQQMHQAPPMHSPQPQYGQPMHQPSPQQSPAPQYQQGMHPPPQPQQHQVSPVSPGAQGPAGSNSAYYTQNPELGHA